MGEHDVVGDEPTQLPCLDEPTVYGYVNFTLPEDRRAQVIAHLDGCASCRELVDDITLGRREATPPRDFGSYRLGAVIAQGGMGRIYRAFDTTLTRDVALKVPRTASPAMMRRFEREAAITARLQHPGIVPIHAAGHSSDGTPFYVMRLVEGRTLDRIVDGTSSPAARLALVEHIVAIAETMAYVHDKRIVHRDLKPNNVLIGEFGETLIIDWGLAKKLEGSSPDARESLPVIGIGTALDTPATRDALRTRAGDVLGTPAFMPPEQAAGEPVDERGDVYALGAMLRYVLAGRIAMPTEAIDAPAPLLEIGKRALAPEPADRFANAGELVIALRAAMAPPKPSERGRRPLAAIASIAVVAATIALAVWALWPRPPAAVGELRVLATLPQDALRPALSPNGKRVAYGSHNRIEIRDLESGRQWTRPAWLAWPYTVEFPTDYVVVFTEHVPAMNERRMTRWNLLADTTEQLSNNLDTYWIGSLEDGQVWIKDHVQRSLYITTPSGDLPVPSNSERALRLFAISPDHQRLAFVENTADGDLLRIVEGAHGRSFTTRLDDVAAIAFRDPDTILYASGTLDGSTVIEIPILDGAFGTPTPIYTTARGGSIGTLAASNDRIVGSWINSSFETRLHERGSHNERHLDKVAASAPLGWRDIVSYWVFNSATRQIERHSSAVNELPVVTSATLPGDPANATMAGELLIVTLRGGEGREVIALHPNERQPRWRTPRGVLAFVRCAGDRAAPCIAGKRAPSGTVSLVRLDPTTGAIGETLVPEAEIADAALDALGQHLTWVVNNSAIYTRAVAGGTPEKVEPMRSGIQSLAFDPTGGILASCAVVEGRAITRFANGKAEVVTNGGPTILSLVRPSTDGTQLLYRARTLSTDLVELRLQ